MFLHPDFDLKDTCFFVRTLYPRNMRGYKTDVLKREPGYLYVAERYIPMHATL